MTWLALNLAAFPESQERLFQSVSSLSTKEALKHPALQQFIRESHRFSPPQFFFTYRVAENPIHISLETGEAITIPPETKITMCLSAIQNDPKLVKDPHLFQPERWTPEEVKKRVSTPQEIIDHRLLAAPFSFGPRMCMGARLAEVELKLFLFQLVRDWEMRLTQKRMEGPWKVCQETMFKASPFPEIEFRRRTPTKSK